MATVAIAHIWGGDILVSPAGDFELVSGADLTTQRIIRRLMTPHGSYIWHPDYGGGLGSFIGGPANVGQVQGVIQEQMDMESSVQSVVSIDVSFEPTNSIMSVSIVYVDLSDDSNQLSFTVGK